MSRLLVRIRLGARSCTGQILDQKIPVGFIFCTVGWSHGKQKYWRGGRVDDCGSLENCWPFTGPGGSNPSLSALKNIGLKVQRCFFLLLLIIVYIKINSMQGTIRRSLIPDRIMILVPIYF